MTAPTWLETVPAATAIARYAAGNKALEHELRDMCGLIAPDGSIPPDDTATYALVDPGGSPGAKDPDSPNPRAFVEHGRRPDGMTTPDGLATLTPIVQQPVSKPSKPKPAVIRQSKPLVVPECGQYKAFARHRRLGEDIDDACYQASLEYGRMANTAYRARKRLERETKRLIAAGVNPSTAALLAAGKQQPGMEAAS